MTKFLGNLIRWFCILILFLFVIALCFLKAGSTGKKVDAGDPALVYTVNRHEYSLGTIAGVTVIHLPGGKIWTSVTWKPVMTPLLYDENLLFCGDVSERFAGFLTTDELALIFSRAVEVARFDGPKPNIMACRNLEAVQKMTQCRTP